MEKVSKPTAHSPLVRLLKTKFLNILVVVVLIVCLLLFMRDGATDGKINVVETSRSGGQAEVADSVESDQTSENSEEDFVGIDDDSKSSEDDGDEDDYDDDLNDDDNVDLIGNDDVIEEEEDIDMTSTNAIISTTPYFTTAGVKVHLHKDGSKSSVHLDFLKVGGFNVGTIKLDHLNNYRNPCFFEEREDTNVVIVGATYRNNPFREKALFAPYFDNLKKMIIRSHEELCGESQGCRLRCLPYFMVIGVAERETLNFFQQIVQHPQVNPPIVPEIAFWYKYRFADTNFNDYLDLYDNATSSIHKKVFSSDSTGKHIYLEITGEAAPIAMMADTQWMNDPRNEDLKEPYTLLAHDLHSLIPSLKFIMLLRNPVSHIYWHYNNAPYGKDKTPEEFHSRVNNSLIWWTQCIASHPLRACVYGTPPKMDVFEDRSDNTWWPKSSHFIGALRDGLYWVYVADYLKVFPRDSFLVIRAEDYIDKPTEVLTKQVFPFLDLSPPEKELKLFSASQNISALDSYKPMLPETENLLSKFYGEYNQKLAEILQDEKFLWKDSNTRVYSRNA